MNDENGSRTIMTVLYRLPKESTTFVSTEDESVSQIRYNQDHNAVMIVREQKVYGKSGTYNRSTVITIPWRYVHQLTHIRDEREL